MRWILIHHQPTPGLRVILARFEKGNSFLQLWVDHNAHFQAVGSSQNLTVIVSRRSEGQVTFSCLSGRKFCSSITKSCLPCSTCATRWPMGSHFSRQSLPAFFCKDPLSFKVHKWEEDVENGGDYELWLWVYVSRHVRIYQTYFDG